MRLRLNGSADAAFPLFGPVREAEWARGWSPTFMAPLPPAQDERGAVFTTQGHDGADAVWVMTRYDARARAVRYVVVRPARVTTEIGVDVSAAGDHACIADVTYRETALSEEGNAEVATWAEHFPRQAGYWEQALNTRLSRP